MRGWLFATALLLPVASRAQEIRFDTPATAPKAGVRQHVEQLTDTVEVQAGKAEVVEVRFRVGAGLHINSHAPKDELLLPTVLTLEPGVKVLSTVYPAGKPFKLAVGAGAVLDVYEGEFRVGLRVVAPKGTTVVKGMLRYQACDTASCFPPRTLPVLVTMVGR